MSTPWLMSSRFQDGFCWKGEESFMQLACSQRGPCRQGDRDAWILVFVCRWDVHVFLVYCFRLSGNSHTPFLPAPSRALEEETPAVTCSSPQWWWENESLPSGEEGPRPGLLATHKDHDGVKSCSLPDVCVCRVHAHKRPVCVFMPPSSFLILGPKTIPIV